MRAFKFILSGAPRLGSLVELLCSVGRRLLINDSQRWAMRSHASLSAGLMARSAHFWASAACAVFVVPVHYRVL